MQYRSNVFYPKTETPLSSEELLSLKHRYDDFDATTELNKISQYVFHQPVLKYEKIIAWGLDHLLYKVIIGDEQEYIFRINNTSAEDLYFPVEELVIPPWYSTPVS